MLRAEGRGSGLAGSGVEHSVERREVEGRVCRVTRVDRPTALPIHKKSRNEDVFFWMQVEMRLGMGNWGKIAQLN